MNQEIQTLWEKRQLPIRSGIYFADGQVVPLGISQTRTSKLRTINVNSGVPIKLNEVLAFQENRLTHIGELCEQIDLNLNLHAYAGEGAWGSEGFIALTRFNSKELIWIAYFEDSNPFTAVFLKDSNVEAVSNHGDTWQMRQVKPDAPIVLTSPLI